MSDTTEALAGTAGSPWGEPELPRDRWGRPMVTPPGGGKAVAYTRCTTYVAALEDTYNLSRWQQRMVATGLARRPDLVLAAAAHSDDRDEMDRICQSELDAAAAGAAAGVGTALHRLTERLDRGQELGVVPEAYRADIEAYRTATADLEPVHIERFCVQDDLKVGGTPDLVVRLGNELFIADKKTGSIDYGAGKIAMQLAMYSRSVFYNHLSRTRESMGGVNQERGIIIHLPAGTGRCELKWVDLTAGWEAIQLATQVRVWRGRKGLIYPLNVAAMLAEIFGSVTEVPLMEQIEVAPDGEALDALWFAHRAVWTDAHTAAARRRKNQLHQQVLRDAVSSTA